MSWIQISEWDISAQNISTVHISAQSIPLRCCFFHEYVRNLLQVNIFCNNFNFIERVGKVSRKLRRVLSSYVVFHVSKALPSYCWPPTGVFIHIFHTQCLYAIWGHESAKTQYLFGFQKRALRIVFLMSKYQFCRSVFCQNYILIFPSFTFLSLSLSFYQELQPV